MTDTRLTLLWQDWASSETPPDSPTKTLSNVARLPWLPSILYKHETFPIMRWFRNHSCFFFADHVNWNRGWQLYSFTWPLKLVIISEHERASGQFRSKIITENVRQQFELYKLLHLVSPFFYPSMSRGQERQQPDIIGTNTRYSPLRANLCFGSFFVTCRPILGGSRSGRRCCAWGTGWLLRMMMCRVT